MAQLVGQCPVHLEVAGSVPNQGTCLVWELGPQWGACRGLLINVLLSHGNVFLSLNIFFLRKFCSLAFILHPPLAGPFDLPGTPSMLPVVQSNMLVTWLDA